MFAGPVGTVLGAELAEPPGPVLVAPVPAGPVFVGPAPTGAVGAAEAVAPDDGAEVVVPPWHEAPLMVQLVGWPAAPRTS